MTQPKFTNWSVTAFGEEIEIIKGTPPDWVKRVLGQEEKCPTTGTLHFQGMITCHSQQRLNKLKSWLPKAHFEPCKDKKALEKYVTKEETRAGDIHLKSNSTYISPTDAVYKLMQVYHSHKSYKELYDDFYRDKPGKKAILEFYEVLYKRWLSENIDMFHKALVFTSKPTIDFFVLSFPVLSDSSEFERIPVPAGSSITPQES